MELQLTQVNLKPTSELKIKAKQAETIGWEYILTGTINIYLYII